MLDNPTHTEVEAVSNQGGSYPREQGHRDGRCRPDPKNPGERVLRVGDHIVRSSVSKLAL